MEIIDVAEDRLDIEISSATGNLIIERMDNYDASEWVFEPDEASKKNIRELRDLLNEWLGDDAAKGAVRASDISFNEGMLRLAAAHKRPVTFRYAKGGGSVIETRTLVPISVAKVGDHMTFTGYDPDRDEPRAYRVDRMMGQVSVA